ncbi:hypothetical protein ACFSJS_08925 [Streptomyces desertarenae]|uniref:Uncharacterized protein n=1 Tax=Streptomyces desertarenae TaxID=2666184 RepID=A0ABW4PHT4_9ACTN
MARGNNEIIPLLVDTKNTIERSVKDVGGQVTAGNQELSRQLEGAVASILEDHRETRDRAFAASTQATQATAEIAGLKREVNALRRTIEDLAALLREAPVLPPESDQAPVTSVPIPPSAPAAAAPAAQPGTTPSVTLTLPGPDSSTAGQDGAPPVPAQRDGSHDTAPPTDQTSEAGTDTGPVDAAEAQPAAGTGGEDDSEAGAAASAADEDQAVETPSEDEENNHGALLLKAARIARVTVVCHRDAWDFIADRAAGHEHFRTTAVVTDEADGLVRVTLSGRSLIGALITLHDTRTEDRTRWDGTWAMAAAFYDRIAEDLYKAGRDGSTPLTIVFNDGITDTTPTPTPQDNPDTPQE